MEQDLTRTNQSQLRFSQTGPRPDATLFVFGAWLALSVALIFATFIFARPFPWLDDFGFLPFVTDKAPLRLEWLWQSHNEHRIPLPMLFCWATLKLDGGTFLLAKYLYAVGLSCCVALLLLSLRKARGYLLWTDVAIPLVLLGFHDLYNTLWFFQAQFVISTILLCFLLAVIVRNDSSLTTSSALLAGISVISLPLCGANGLVVAIPLIIWLLYSALNCFRRGPMLVRAGTICLFSSIISIIVCVFYFVGLNSSLGGAPRPWWKICQDAAGLMAFGSGYGAKLSWRAAGSFMIFVIVGTALMLLFTAWKRRHQRYQAIGLFVMIAALVALASSIAYGRDISPFTTLGYHQDRYAMLLSPLSVACYLAVSSHLGTNRWGRGLRLLLPSLFLLALPYNVSEGVQWGRKFDRLFDGMYDDVFAGRPAWAIAAKYQGWEGIHPWGGEFEATLLELKRAKALGMAHLNEAFPGEGYSIVYVSPFLTQCIRSAWDPVSGKGQVTGESPGLGFDLKAQLKVAALQMKLTCYNVNGEPISSPLTYLCTQDGRWDVRLLQNVLVRQYDSLTITKYMDSEVRHIVLCIPYGTARFELNDLIAICRR